MQTQTMLNQFQGRVKKVNDYFVHPINNNLVDVFRGHGWENHSRYRRIKGKWIHVAGTQLTIAELSKVLQ